MKRNGSNFNLGKVIAIVILVPLVIWMLYIIFKSVIIALRLLAGLIGIALVPILFLILLFGLIYLIVYLVKFFKKK